jgi:hypothetical protein
MSETSDTNDRSASKDDAAQEANVSPMAPFRNAIEKIDGEIMQATVNVAAHGDSTDDSARALCAYSSAKRVAFIIARSIFADAMEEASLRHEVGCRSSMPSG